ncbi:prolyl oligopeptidase family serine peptidase [Rheinheimera sp. F8]|uniref:S9 family peptidase n=1 Tax=Rheinheimera sp. F8 TaxID=1763998 RepID=UPI000744A43A|nr:prolyl oligopeptidase family serine peptidase [Rheinheimera sp. F8]ALZ74947.1 peptidase S9 [Rheinheimera sp. F8]ALZ76627.1 peptidase S9 [Rheinheimera sp. F8]
MKKLRYSTIALALTAILSTAPVFAERETDRFNLQTQQIQGQSGTVAMTIEQAMAHQDWLGRQPELAYWSADSQSLIYQRKQAGNELRDWHQVRINGGQSTQIALNDLDDVGAAEQVFSADRKFAGWIFEGNVFVKSQSDGKISQLTRSNDNRLALQFLTDGRVAWRQGWDFYAVDLNSGLLVQLASLKLDDAPTAPEVPDGYLAKEQHKLIKFVALEHKNALDLYQQQEALRKANNTVAVTPVYLGKDKQISDAALSPDGSKLVLALGAKTRWNDDRDIMPNYITGNGDIAAQPVRRRVNDQKPEPEQFFLVDLIKAEAKELKQDVLSGFDEDVLASVKAENAKRNGKTYKSEKKPRAITLINDWNWDQSAIRWNADGSQVALMLKAWDNKDRWLATVDFQKAGFIEQHRLHDDAWINYDFNNFGWAYDNQLYFLSEQSGYSHLYLKALNGDAKKLTSGSFEVSQPQLSRDGRSVYYRANAQHPGIYNVFKLALDSGKTAALTQLNGNLTFKLSPDEQKLLVRYSTSLLPEELYVMDNQPSAPLKRLTYTVSKELQNMALQAPQVVAVPSSHGKAPVYAKLYLPKDYQQGEKRRAVIFNHGAGYLQNSDLGWSNYFREFFFHNLLTQKGYVVLDMDYRASKGYGRDWRTAIYRQMGTPEIEDLADGVNWLVDNAHVDRARIGTYGGSYGGFMTFMAMFKQPELFKAGSALRPVGDWAYYNHPYTANILNTPDVDPIAYERSSPIYFTEGLKGQLLINSPMVDDNVFFQDSVRVVQRLIEHEINSFETAIFPVEPHGFRQPSSWLDEYRRIEKLFDRTL